MIFKAQNSQHIQTKPTPLFASSAESLKMQVLRTIRLCLCCKKRQLGVGAMGGFPGYAW